MSESPVPSDPEKNGFSSEKHAVDYSSTPVYDEAVGETEAVEFQETHDLKRGLHQRHIQVCQIFSCN